MRCLVPSKLDDRLTDLLERGTLVQSRTNSLAGFLDEGPEDLQVVLDTIHNQRFALQQRWPKASPRQREILALKAMYPNATSRQIGAVLRLDHDTVRVQLHRVRAKGV